MALAAAVKHAIRFVAVVAAVTDSANAQLDSQICNYEFLLC